MNFLKGTVINVLTLGADDTNTLTWHIYLALEEHTDMKHYTVVVFKMGKGAIISSSTEQKLNSRRSA